MAEDWSRSEVEATVADYFDMLDAELRGQSYNKTDHRRRLSTLLRARSDGAIERKHQNISAALIELGFPYIAGYKPLRNYQRLLFGTVADRLAARNELVELVRAEVEQPAALPAVDDILSALVEAPTPDQNENKYSTRALRERAPVRTGIDYFAREASNRSLGLAGEEFVVRFEVARLISVGQERLASRVEHVSQTQGDGAGFDVRSFEPSGHERLIEVKTTAYGPLTPFFVTKNEVAVSHRSEGYHLYRTFDFRRQPKLFTKQGPLAQSFLLDPVQFLARVP
jgi:hypothetical protein